jgi:hypothetical protein
MNTQDILRHSERGLDAVLDFSEYYDFELLQTYPISQIDSRIDISEQYDYELLENVLGKTDAVLDYSEYYDYVLGDNTIDYIYYEIIIIKGCYLLTENSCIIKTEDNCYIEI